MNKNKKVEVRKSKISGNGIFATRNLKKGERVGYITGNFIKLKEEELIKKFPSEQNWVGVAKNKWIDPELPFVAINHSCNPNVGIKGVRTFVTLKEIKKDEEVVFDYSISEMDMTWSMKCSCGNLNCRKEIKSIQFLPKDQLKKYMPFVPVFFKDIYDSR